MPQQQKRVSSPQDRAKENALFADAGLDPKDAAAQTKDPEAAASILARKHAHAVVRLIGDAMKRGGEQDLVAARRVASHLFDKGARLIDVFLRAKPRNDVILARVAKLVGEVGAPEGVERLRKLLSDPAAPVRAAAFEGLAKGMDPDKLALLAREAVTDGEESPEVKLAAIEALGEAKAIGASSIAAKCIHDGNGDVRKAAARALTRMGIGAIPSILEDCRARGQAALGSVVDSIKAIMGVSGDINNAPPELHEQVRKLLTASIRDKDAPVRCACAVALGAIGTKDDVPVLDDAITFEKNEFSQAQMECARGDLKKRVGAS
ncbi:MAG TPA: HEAT repeat domain-containing protein [Planctomycetota bacterium]|nr:HEAT repeat domain-containing protein [Planctomycetota bacterium]